MRPVSFLSNNHTQTMTRITMRRTLPSLSGVDHPCNIGRGSQCANLPE